MTALILTEGAPQWTIPAGGNVEVYGTGGEDSLAFENDANVVLDASFNAGNDVIYLEGDSDDFTVVASGATVTLTHSGGGTITIPAGTSGQTLVFGDGALDLMIDITGEDPVIMLGDQTVDETDTAVTATVDDTQTSDAVFGGGADEGDPVVTDDQAFDLSETATEGTVVGTVAATDEDGTIQAFNIVTGNTDGYFAIDAAGVITLTAEGAANIDFETAASYTLGIQALDNEFNQSEIVDVDVNLTDVVEPELSISDAVTVAEGDSGTTAVEYTVTLSAAPGAGETVTVDYATADGTATAGSDYTAASGTLTFAEGETSKTFEVLVTGDANVEDDEVFTVSLSNATGSVDGADASIVVAESSVTIINDDIAPASYTLVADTTSVTEGEVVTFTLTALDADGNPSPVTETTFNYQISGVEVAGGTADPANDLGKVTGEITIPAGQSSATFTLTPTDDGVTEGFEGFKVSLLDDAFNTVAETGNVVIKDGAEAGISQAFTVGTDTLIGASGDDTFTGVLQADGDTGTTLAPGDSANGGDGNDTMTVSVAGDAGGLYTLSAITLTDIENLYLSNFDTDATADGTVVATGLMTGLETVGLSASGDNGATVFSGMKNFVDAEMSNGSATLKLTYDGAQAVTGTDDTQNLTLSNVTAGTFTADGIETINVAVELVDSDLTAVVSNKLTTLNIAGDKDLDVANAIDFDGTASGTAITGTLDASTFTGDLDVTVGADDENIAVTLGLGDDTIDFQGTLDEDDTLDGGDGSDTLKMDAAALTTQLDGVSNVEILSINEATAGVNVDASKLSDDIETIVLDVNDDTHDDGAKLASTVTNLTDQTVSIKHTTEDADDVNDSDGVAYTLSNATDTADDTISVKLDAVGTDNATGAAGDVNFGVDELDVSNYETVNVESAANATGTVTANELEVLTAASATAVSFSGDADLTVGSIVGVNVATVDGSTMTGELDVTLSSVSDVTVTASQDDTVIDFGTTFTNADTVIGGAGDDTVVADINGLTATTGALNITDVETVLFDSDSASNVIDAAGLVGVDTIGLYSASATSVTLNNLAADVAISLGSDLDDNNDDFDGATLTVTLADDSAADDSLTVVLDERSDDADIDAVLVAENIETLVIDDDDDGENALIDISDFDATTVTLTGGVAGSVADFTKGGAATLSTSTTTVDASGFAGSIKVDASATSAPAVTVDAVAATAANVITGSANDDTFTIEGYSANAEDIDGGAGDDTLNITVKNGYTDASDITNVETVNVDVKSGDDVTLATGFTDAVTDDITLTGGNSLSTFATGNDTNAALQSFDASSFFGNIEIGFAAGALDDSVAITGGALTTDKVTGLYTADPASTVELDMDGVETLALSVDDVTGTWDVSGAAGLTTISVNETATTGADTITLDEVTDQTIVVDTLQADGTLEVKLASATGSDDSVNFTTDGGAVDGATLKTLDIETVNIKAGTAAETISIDNVKMTSATEYVSVVVTGDKELTLDAIDADIDSIDASANTGGLVMTGVAATDITITGSSSVANTLLSGAGDDILVGGSGDDSFTGAAGSDTYTGGAGADDFNLLYNESNKLILDTITDFGTGDEINLINAGQTNDVAAAALGSMQSLSEFATFSDYLDLIADQDATEVDDADAETVVEWFQFEGNTYIGFDGGAGTTFATATDAVVELTGLIDLSASTVTFTAATDLINIDYVAV